MSKLIRKDDKVIVIAGNDKGKTGVVLSRKKDRIIVQGINVRKKHIRRTQQAQTVQILELEMPIHISNVVFCSADNKPLKVKSRTVKGKKQLYYMDKGKEVVLRTKAR